MALQWPWRRESKDLPAKAETKSAALGLTEALGSFMIFGQNGATTASAALSLYEQSTAVSIPINMITDPFSVLQPILLVDGQLVEHEVIDFIKEASPYFEQELFLESIAKDYLITGENYIVALGRIQREPIEMQGISPRNISVPEGPGGVPSGIHVTGNTLSGIYVPERVGAGQIRYLDGTLRELKQTRNWSTRNNSLLRGQSRLVSAAKEVRQHILGGTHNVSLLEKGGRVSLVFQLGYDGDDDAFEANAERIRAQYGGASSAGKIAVLSGEKMEIKTIGASNVDMDFANLQKMATRAVGLQYRVPLPLLSDERQTLNNYREGKLALFDDAMIPLSRVLFGSLGSFLLPRFGLDPTRARITFDPEEVSALVSRRNDEMLKRKQIAIETDNELRALMRREPIEGGDVLYRSAGEIPVGTDLETDDNDPDNLDDEEFESG